MCCGLSLPWWVVVAGDREPVGVLRLPLAAHAGIQAAPLVRRLSMQQEGVALPLAARFRAAVPVVYLLLPVVWVAVVCKVQQLSMALGQQAVIPRLAAVVALLRAVPEGTPQLIPAAVGVVAERHQALRFFRVLVAVQVLPARLL